MGTMKGECKMKTILTTLALLASLGAAQAGGTVTAKEWIKYCDGGKNPGNKIACLAYVRGVADGLNLWNHAETNTAPVCIPSDVNTDQLVAVGQKFFRDSPKDRHLTASVFLGFAFLDAWPCDLPDGGKYIRK